MRVRVKRIEDHSEEESALLRIFKVNETIKKAIELLQNPHDRIIVQNIKSDVTEKIAIDEVIYAEYLERNVFLYTKEATYSLRTSLTKFMKDYSYAFIQIKKNIVLNGYFAQSFVTTGSGNLIVIVSTGEKLIVSRRYIKTLKDSLSKLTCTRYA